MAAPSAQCCANKHTDTPNTKEQKYYKYSKTHTEVQKIQKEQKTKKNNKQHILQINYKYTAVHNYLGPKKGTTKKGLKKGHFGAALFGRPFQGGPFWGPRQLCTAVYTNQYTTNELHNTVRIHYKCARSTKNNNITKNNITKNNRK